LCGAIFLFFFWEFFPLFYNREKRKTKSPDEREKEGFKVEEGKKHERRRRRRSAAMIPQVQPNDDDDDDDDDDDRA